MSRTVAKRRRTPQYQAIADDMIARVERGDWARGHAIPPIGDLEVIYPASRVTILKAAHQLEERGYLSIEHGRGTFVRQQLPGRRVGILCGDDIFSVPPPPFTAIVCQRLRHWLDERGYQPQVYVVETYDVPEGEVYPNHQLRLELKRELLRGLILLSTEPVPAVTEDAAARHLPLVDIGGNINHPAHLEVCTDNMVGVCLEWLAKRGRRRVGLIAFSEAGDERGLRLARHHGVELLTEGARPHHVAEWHRLVADGVLEVALERTGYERARRLLRRAAPPDALLVTDDVIAKGVVHALLEAGVRVPDDVLLLAHANSGIASFSPIPMVKYEIDTEEIAARAGRLLLAQVQGKPLPKLPPIHGRIREVSP